MSIASCKCGHLIDTDANPESYYFEGPDGKEIALDEPMCDGCKEIKYEEAECYPESNSVEHDRKEWREGR